ncbi:hypothetical protein JKP88DRAFT_277720 [Tribonema minus]|uniref:Uncharacterized protein n=1 Tax=Tribonema minus TaxID=303371 RepID=A0A835Z594_9STRA|nr:hypothetical protein JKP88DRAFT_277720 [Tribonema minus]
MAAPDATTMAAAQKEKQYTLVYVHAALTEGGAGPDILREQLQHIKASGLWDSMHHLFLGVLGDVSLVPQEFLKDGKLSLIFDTPELDFFEFPTLHTLQTHAKRIFPESNMLYIHTKGVNRRPLAREWRELLMFCLVDNWQTCLADVFGAGFETCGCQLQGGPDGFPVHYSGNFWWTKASVAAEAPDIWSYRGTQDRMECEFWLLGRVQDYELSKSKHYCLWHSHRNMYDVATAKNEYESQDFLPDAWARAAAVKHSGMPEWQRVRRCTLHSDVTAVLVRVRAGAGGPHAPARLSAAAAAAAATSALNSSACHLSAQLKRIGAAAAGTPGRLSGSSTQALMHTPD